MKRFLLFLALPLMSLASGCSQTEPAPICDMGAILAQRQLVSLPALVSGQASPLEEMPLNSVSIIDERIMRKLFIRSVSAQRTATGTVRVNSQIVNCTDFPLALEARTRFIAEDKASPVEPVSAWKRIYLPARSSESYSESSITRREAHHYLVELRENR